MKLFQSWVKSLLNRAECHITVLQISDHGHVTVLLVDEVPADSVQYNISGKIFDNFFYVDCYLHSVVMRLTNV